MFFKKHIKPLYDTLKLHRKRIEDLERKVRLLQGKQRTNAIGQQMEAVEDVLGYGGPVIPYDPDHYTMPPKIQDDSIFKCENELWEKKKRSYE
jgi:hypothetical protein